MDLCLRIDCQDGLFKARKPICTEEKDIHYSAILQIVEHSQTEFAGFIGPYRDTEEQHMQHDLRSYHPPGLCNEYSP